MQYLVISFEAAFPVDKDCGNAIQNTLEALRSEGAARATASRILENEEAYETWYSDRVNAISEVEVPLPQVISFD